MSSTHNNKYYYVHSNILNLIDLSWLVFVYQYIQNRSTSHCISSQQGNCSDLLTCPPASAPAYTAARLIPQKQKSDAVTPLLRNPPVPPHSPQSKRQKTLQ